MGYKYFSKNYYNDDGSPKSQKEIDKLRIKVDNKSRSVDDAFDTVNKRFVQTIKLKTIKKRKVIPRLHKNHVIELFDRDCEARTGRIARTRHRNNVKVEIFDSKYTSSLDGQTYYRYEPKCICGETRINELGINVDQSHKINSLGSYEYLKRSGFPTRDVICRKCAKLSGRKFAK